MRRTLLPLALLSCIPTMAQVDINKAIEERMRQHAAGQGAADERVPMVPNTFVGSFRMESHNYRNGAELKESPTNLRYWSSPERTLTKVELPQGKGQDMRLMLDLKDGWQYMLMTDDKGKRTAMKQRPTRTDISGKDGAEPKVTVTKETRDIDGHTCTKVIAESTDGTWTGWVALGMPGPYRDMLRTVRTGDSRLTKRMSDVNGFALEWEWTDANGKDRTQGFIRELVTGKVDESIFSLDGYQVTEMPSFGR
jgi:hypothetical protein